LTKRDTPNVADRRKWQRVELDCRVRLFTYDGQEQVLVNGQLSDLSEGGLSLFIPAALQAGDIVDLEINLPYSSEPARLKAVVRSRSNFRYGLEFVDLTMPQRKLIARACSVLKLID
jgi:c-di-GMP-binding flagellar brake protein YcgR